MRIKTVATILSLGGLMAGCAEKPKPVVVAPEVLPAHIWQPRSAVCTVAPFKVADGGTAEVAMTIKGDGGYCSTKLAAASGKYFDSQLVPVLPQHGQSQVIRYNGKTHIEYRAAPGYVGRDAFTVKLIVAGRPGYTTLKMAITVQ